MHEWDEVEEYIDDLECEVRTLREQKRRLRARLDDLTITLKHCRESLRQTELENARCESCGYLDTDWL